MTYVSRKTRIIVSRWSDECDAEYTFRAWRRRNDGRLKRHISCDDLRAWVNDNCIKHEYLVELMSDGEFIGESPLRLYGRFIPVPILFKLAQKTTVAEIEDKKTGVRSSRSETNKYSRYPDKSAQAKKSTSETRNQNSKSELELEKNLLERRLCECTCLLNKAVRQLEKIDSVVGYPNEEWEKERSEEIRNSFYKSKVLCTCPTQKTVPERPPLSKLSLKKLEDSINYAEIMRKVSGLRLKLEKNQVCRKEVEQQIRLSQARRMMCGSSDQVAELYTRKEQAHERRLIKKQERLMSERGGLLFEICQALKCLKNLKNTKKLSKTSARRPKKSSPAYRNSSNSQGACSDNCSCKCSEQVETTDSEQVQCSDFSYRDTSLTPVYFNCNNYDSEANDCEPDDAATPCLDEFLGDENLESEPSEEDRFRCDEVQSRNEANSVYGSTSGTFNSQRQKDEAKQTDGKNYSSLSESTFRVESGSNGSRKSRVRFECPQRSCKRALDQDDLSAYEKSLSSTQQALILGALRAVENRRPSTTPTTKKERQAVELEHPGNEQVDEYGQGGSQWEKVFERQAKSETTMKEIEKTLRNYELRLSELDSLECRVEELKKRSSEACRYKRKLERLKCRVRKQGEAQNAERERSRREMTKLHEENWELKKQVQQLTIMFEAQYTKIRSMRCGVIKARELECEAEELKKELSEYRDSYNQQRKCISKWESVVAVQRTEIERLMNHIRKLTTAKEDIPRSRSYSPEGRMTRGGSRPKSATRNYRMPSSSEETPCCCSEYLQDDSRWGSQQGSSDLDYRCSSPPRGMEWCN